MLVKSRQRPSAVAAQDVPVGLFANGNSYQLSLPVFPSAACTAQAVLTLTSTGSGVETFSTSPVTLQKNESGVFVWTDLKGTLTPTWTGSLTKATVSISMSVKNNYYLDKVSLVDVTYPKDDYILDRQLLSPSVNPTAAGRRTRRDLYCQLRGQRRGDRQSPHRRDVGLAATRRQLDGSGTRKLGTCDLQFPGTACQRHDSNRIRLRCGRR